MIPWMKLGELEGASLSPPPAPLPRTNPPNENARLRFAVSGNAVVTGGAGALALASARALLEHGLNGLALLDLQSGLDKGAVHIEALRQAFPNTKIVAIACDVTSESEVQHAVESARHTLGPFKILCCFAGLPLCVSAEDMTFEQWRSVTDVNLTGSWLVAQAVGRVMIKDRSGGRIVFISSISAHRVNYPQPQMAYNVSKAGILQMRSSLAAEWARHGIRVNSISPGYMDTVLNEGDALAGHRAVWADRNPMRRMGSPDELTGSVVLLCSDFGGSYLNGMDIVVDGERAGCYPLSAAGLILYAGGGMVF